jgi:acyl-CoA synthetase (AMP-forming)/AMP-acid ligase II
VNLSNILAHHTERFGDRPALSTEDEELTYREFYERVQRTAGALRELGVERSDVVGVLLYNRIEFLALMGACAHLGAIFMPLNWRLAGPELAYIADHAEARLLVSEPELEHNLDELREQGGERTWVRLGEASDDWLSLADAYDAAAPVTEAEPVKGEDVMRLMYTSGTTSRPKGVMITYDNLYWKCAAQVVELEVHSSDRGLACGPLYHVGALDMVTTNMLYVGAATHLLPRFDVGKVLDAIEQRRLTVIWLAPAMVNALLAAPDLAERDLDSVRLIQDGGEKMPLPLIEKVIAAFPNAWFADAYGMTETVSGDTYLDKGKMIEKLGSVGKPVLHTEVRVVDAADEPVPAGERGEIVMRGPKVCLGYWKDEQATRETIRDGWLHTGDIGLIDEDGFLFIVDRLNDLIISGGENIASSEVERAIYEHPDVEEAAVVGRPHPKWNEVPVAYVVLRDDASVDEQALDAHCKERLAKYKTPKGFRFVSELPRNPSGKILKRELRDREVETADEEQPAAQT